MEQPKLGIKIAELRKAKGLTQEELVQKCEITVRTLQRIESGEVTPRSYTIKAIFKALNYDYYDSLKVESQIYDVSQVVLPGRLHRIQNYVAELFNLKTNTMKKLLILSIPVFLISMLLISIGYNATAQRRMQKKLIGTWQICKADSTIDMELYNLNKKVFRYKVLTKETFAVIDINGDEKQTYNNFWGTYTVKNNEYTEFIQFASPGFRHIFGEMNSFNIEIKKDLMFIKGINSDENEIWKKVKD